MRVDTINYMSDIPPICDYEGSDYQSRFWVHGGREYEDQVERVALRRLMPKSGKTLIDIGAGFGRLGDEYAGYETVVLMDYSKSLLMEAREKWGHDPRFKFVSANWYAMPFVDGLFETMVQVRTIHHAANVPDLFVELSRIAKPDGTYILEFANKQNLKAMARYALKKQAWSPYTHEPIEFVEMNFDFHPHYIREILRANEFVPGKTLTVSHFRIGALKRTVPTEILVRLDSMAQKTGDWWQLTPSVFIKNQHPRTGTVADGNHFFACPTCKAPLSEQGESLPCSCGEVWSIEDGVYIFK